MTEEGEAAGSGALPTVVSLDAVVKQARASKLPNSSWVLWAADCAENVLHIFETQHPNDNRPRLAIEAARSGDTNAAYAAGSPAAYAAGSPAADAADAADAAYAAGSPAAGAAYAAAYAAYSAAYAAYVAGASAGASAARAAVFTNRITRSSWEAIRLLHYINKKEQP